MDISVVIPFYDCEAFVGEAIDSVLNQSFKPKQVIVVNDSPSTSSKRFLSQFQDRVQLIHLDRNHGISTARNIGIQNSRCDWIAFQDADDVWLPRKLERQVAFLEANPQFDACHTGIEVFSGDEILATYNEKPSVLRMKDALMTSQLLPPATLVRASALHAVGLFDHRALSSVDTELTIRLLESGAQIGFIGEVLTRVRREGHGHISSRWKPALKGHLHLYRKHYRIYREHRMRRKYLKWAFAHAAVRSTGATHLAFKCLSALLPDSR